MLANNPKLSINTSDNPGYKIFITMHMMGTLAKPGNFHTHFIEFAPFNIFIVIFSHREKNVPWFDLRQQLAKTYQIKMSKK